MITTQSSSSTLETWMVHSYVSSTFNLKIAAWIRKLHCQEVHPPPSWFGKKAAPHYTMASFSWDPPPRDEVSRENQRDIGCDWSPSGWIIRYEFLFVKYDWKRWRELLNFSSFPWNWRSEWCVYVAHLQLVIQAVGFLERLVPPFDSWICVALTCFPLKTHLIPKAIMSSFHRMLKNHTAYVKKSWSRESSNPNLSTRDLARVWWQVPYNFSS